jgi:dTDP-glucose pyrophosphorylase
MRSISGNLVQSCATVKDAIETIESATAKIALVIEGDGRLVGTVTDGDIRRAILHGIGIDAPVTKIMTSDPHVGRFGHDNTAKLNLIRKSICRHIPIVDDRGRVVALEMLDEPFSTDNWIVLMAGGVGHRLLPLTKEIPKPMLPIGGKPILESILEGFRAEGFTRFFISLHHLGDVIQAHFGDGSRWGVQIEYLSERKPLGTAGALALLPEKPTKPIFVMNGDILTKLTFGRLLGFHEDQNADITMCVSDYHMEVPFGVVENDNYKILRIREKPRQRYLVNAGIYVLNPQTLDLIPRDCYYDMPSLIGQLIENGQNSCVFPIREYWMDVGRMDDFKRAQSEFSDSVDDLR